jgi:hypothetical protein
MTTSVQALSPAVQVSLHSGDGQYTITGSATSLFVIRQQAQGQQVVAFAFLNAGEVIVHFQFAQELTAESHEVLAELLEALHAAHTVEGLPLPAEPTAMIQVMEQSIHGLAASLSGELN